MKNRNSGNNRPVKEAGSVITAGHEAEEELVLHGSLLKMLHELDGQEFILTIPIEEDGDKDE